MDPTARSIGPSAARGPSLRNPWTSHDAEFLRSYLAGPMLGQLSEALRDATSDLRPLDPSTSDPLGAVLIRIREHYLRAHQLGGTLHLASDLPSLDLPENRLRSVFEHLVEGALRENESVRPFCHVGVLSQADETLTLFVRDNGRALPECTIGTLRAFVREHGALGVPDRVYRLFLADNLVQSLGGRLWIGPAPDRAGTCVFLRLPRRMPATTPS